MPNKQATSDTELARIRAAAHRYVLAGGPLFRISDGGDDTDRDDHIGAIRARLFPKAEPAFSDRLEHVVPASTAYKDHEELYGDAWMLIAAESEAAYLFGVNVGLEVAALTLGTALTAPPQRTKGDE